PDPAKIGRAFSNACVELALASYPGCTITAPPGEATTYGVYWPTLVPSEAVQQIAVLPDGTQVDVKHTPGSPPRGHRRLDMTAPVPEGPTRRVPLGTIFGARSGDKGGNANVGVWSRSESGFNWLLQRLTAEALAELLPETAAHRITRNVYPNLYAVNFV